MSRPPLQQIYLRLAKELSRRSTCVRLAVGTVLTDPSMEQVYSVGYNGNVRGFPNKCDREEVGNCGCIHAEQNALVKAPGSNTPKHAFITLAPCEVCAKLLVQSGVKHVTFIDRYRNSRGLSILEEADIPHRQMQPA